MRPASINESPTLPSVLLHRTRVRPSAPLEMDRASQPLKGPYVVSPTRAPERATLVSSVRPSMFVHNRCVVPSLPTDTSTAVQTAAGP